MQEPASEDISNIARRRAAARDDARSGYLDRRREIAHAASRVFKERGFSGTTLRHVAEALGIDRASLYYYVGSKDELFQEIVTEAVHVNLASAEKLHAEQAPAPVKIRRFVVELMVSYAEYYPVLYVLLQENLSHVAPEHGEWADNIRYTYRRYEQILVEMVQQGQDEGSLRAASPAWVVAYGILGMAGWSNRWFNPAKSPMDAHGIGSAFADMVLDGLVATG